MQSLTLNNFLHHTSGLTNIRHTQNIPQGNTPDMLQKTVEMLVDAELAFPPVNSITMEPLIMTYWVWLLRLCRDKAMKTL